MKYLLWIVVTLLALVATVFALQYAASERIEVVELQSLNDAGETVTTRLWVVDHDGLAYLRGEEGSGWYARILSNPRVKLTRNGNTSDYRAIPRPGNREVINRLMQDKYTWGDTIIYALVGGRTDSIPIELRPDDS